MVEPMHDLDSNNCLSVLLVNQFSYKECKQQQCELRRKTKGTEILFLKAITVWINKPHVVNRRLCGAKLISVNRVDSSEQLGLFFKDHVNLFGSDSDSSNTHTQDKDRISFEDLSMETALYTIITRELIPKSEFFPKVLEVLVYDKSSKTVCFIPIADGDRRIDGGKPYFTNEISYSVQFMGSGPECSSSSDLSNEVVMSWSCDHEQPEVSKRQLSSKWLSSILLDKLLNWSVISDISTSVKSLQLVDVEEYQKTYTRLKNTYGRDLVKNWTESTDPQKFVYEDIAIASYLLLVWQEDRQLKNIQHKQTFVDLGCGNGLLVYILTKEGHKGLGIDLRKRKIWDTFGSETILQESMVKPSSEHLFPEYDWIIGNHSDELTPWIPVIAARSSYDCCFFVLPCCHFDFVGKFTTSEKGKSKYASYLSYVQNVISNCGFNPECDTLRIPSTKRISYIGRYRTYAKSEEEETDKLRQAFIDSHNKQRHAQKDVSSQDISINEGNESDRDVSVKPCDSASSNFEHSCDTPSTDKRSFVCVCNQDVAEGHDQSEGDAPSCKKCKVEKQSDTSTQWASDFKPRVETKVRNCQSVSDKTKQSIVDAVFNKVLAADRDNVVPIDSGVNWCKGGAVPLSQVVPLFDKAILQELKSECGGLQTLLRNHSHIFQVTEGNVQLRDFTKADPWAGRNPQKSKNKKRNTLKTILCWFYSHHPDGCPKQKSDCQFAHGEEDLQQKFIKEDQNS